MRGFRLGDKGQMHTVEGLIAAVIMILVLVLVVKSTAITPLSSSSTNKHVQLELMNMGNDVLTSLDYDVGATGTSPLKYSILDWDGSQFVLSDGKKYIGTYDISDHSLDNNQLAQALYFAFNKYGVAYNVEIFYLDSDGKVVPASNNNYVSDHPSMIWNGDPSDNSVTVSKVIAIHNGDIGSIQFYDHTHIPPIAPTTTTDLYNLIIVKLTLWRM
jgi:hypothetical protein